MSVMESFPVSVTKRLALADRMRRLGVSEGDLEERFLRSSGPGGQRTNKVSTCVVLRHRPSGLAVRCQRERLQGLNRFLARRLLLDRLEAQRLGRLSEEAQRIAKIRRQKRRRSRRAKEKMLAAKHHRAQVKAGRHRVAPDAAEA
jgi:protein subunit release factor B